MSEQTKQPTVTSDSPHDLLLERVPRDQAVHVDHVLLADAVRAVHGLQVLHGVPVVLHEDHGVRARQVQPEAAHLHTAVVPYLTLDLFV